MFTFVSLARVTKLLVIVLATALAACTGGQEGDRCNPDLSHNDCSDGLTCVTPSTCAENYCCPNPPSSSDNAYCNGAACPAASMSIPDAGTE